MRWLRRSEAAEALGIKRRAVRTLADKGEIPTRYEGRLKLYCISDDMLNKPVKEVDEFFEQSSDKYIFDSATDTYLFFGLPNQPPVVKVPRPRIDSLISDYSNEAGGATINQLSVRYELSRATIKAILNWLGKTHDSAPFSDETLEHSNEEDLASSVLRAKEQRVLVRAQKKRLNRHENYLNQVDLVKHYINEVYSIVGDIDLKGSKPKKRKLAKEVKEYVAVLGLTDLHIGKRGVDGYNSEVASKRAINTVTKATTLAQGSWGIPDYWVITCGSDMLHVDNYQGTTQKGTPMDTDVDPVEMMAIAYRTMETIVLLLQETAPVKVVAMTGNHDRMLSALLGMMIGARFNDDPRIEVIDGSRGSAYIRYGASLLGFNHGDSIKPDKLPSIMSAERPEDWGACKGNWDWFCGHLHSLILKVSEHNGCRVWTMPALSGTDRWHKLNGYAFNRKQLAMFRVEPNNGVVAVELIEGKDKDG